MQPFSMINDQITDLINPYENLIPYENLNQNNSIDALFEERIKLYDYVESNNIKFLDETKTTIDNIDQLNIGTFLNQFKNYYVQEKIQKIKEYESKLNILQDSIKKYENILYEYVNSSNIIHLSEEKVNNIKNNIKKEEEVLTKFRLEIEKNDKVKDILIDQNGFVMGMNPEIINNFNNLKKQIDNELMLINKNKQEIQEKKIKEQKELVKIYDIFSFFKSDSVICPICIEKNREMFFFECGHVCCKNCISSINNICYLCRIPVNPKRLYI